MMDVVLGGAMGLLLAVVLSSPPKPKKVKALTATVVEDAPESKPAKGEKKKK